MIPDLGESRNFTKTKLNLPFYLSGVGSVALKKMLIFVLICSSFILFLYLKLNNLVQSKVTSTSVFSF